MKDSANWTVSHKSDTDPTAEESGGNKVSKGMLSGSWGKEEKFRFNTTTALKRCEEVGLW